MPKTVTTGGREATRQGRALHKWVNSKTPGSSEVVLTDATLYYNIPTGKQVLVTQLCFDLETMSDDCCFTIVSCSAVAGGGTSTAITGCIQVFTGNVQSGSAAKERMYVPSILVTYSSGARSITLRVNANDANAVISCGWMGEVEDEP